MTKDEARKIVENVLRFSTADDTVVRIEYSKNGATRFSNNTITQNVCNTNASINITVAFGNRIGRVSGDDMDDESLKLLVRRAEEMAKAK